MKKNQPTRQPTQRKAAKKKLRGKEKRTQLLKTQQRKKAIQKLVKKIQNLRQTSNPA